jgi:hypothetical protein
MSLYLLICMLVLLLVTSLRDQSEEFLPLTRAGGHCISTDFDSYVLPTVLPAP